MAFLACKSPPAPSGAPGAAVQAVPGSAPPRVEAGADGFQPSRVVLRGAKQVVFRRTTEDTCATAVVFPELNIEKQLPLNTDVVIDLPASAPAEIGFQCSMAMYKSKIVAR